MNAITKKLEVPGLYKFESVDGVKTSPTLAYVSADLSKVAGLEDVYFKATINLEDKTFTLSELPKYKNLLDGFDVETVMTSIIDNINGDTLYASHSNGEGAVLMVHTPLKAQLKCTEDSALGRAALLAAEMPGDLGSDMPELEADEADASTSLTIDN